MILQITPDKFPFPLEGASLPCTESTVKRILADLENKSKSEMIHRLRARESAIMKKFKRTTEKAKSMVDFINLALARMYKDLEKTDPTALETLQKVRPDPSLSKIELEIIKILIFIMEDNQKVRNIVFRLVRKDDALRILDPFVLEEPQEKELSTINELNKMEVTDFDGKLDYTTSRKIENLLVQGNRKTPTSIDDL